MGIAILYGTQYVNLARRVKTLLTSYGLKVTSFTNLEKPVTLPSETEVALIIGGDGTVLRAIHYVETLEKTLLLPLGVGKLNFLSEYTVYEAEEAIARVVKHDYTLEEYPLIAVYVEGTKVKFINDIVIKPETPRPMIKVTAYIPDVDHVNYLVYRNRADGILLSSTLGSTAYLLSTGGPIVDPELKAIVFKLLNPHTPVANLPYVLPVSKKLHIDLTCEHRMLAIVDGTQQISLSTEVHLELYGVDSYIKFIRFHRRGESFYDKVFRRLHTP